MSRIVSVWLPAWPMNRLARARMKAGRSLPWIMDNGRETPFALVESGAHGLCLAAINADAWRQGLRPGMALADARAVLPSLLTLPAEPENDAKALTALAEWAGRYGPSRNVEGSDGLWIDTTGVAHLYGGEEPMLTHLLDRLARAGITARLGLADTAGAAFALARFATRHRSVRIAPPGAVRETLAPLPVAALRLPADAVLLLQRLGLSRIGQLYDLPRETLAQRFRATRPSQAAARASQTKRERQAQLTAGAVLARLDQALGSAPEPRRPRVEPPRHHARQVFPEPLVTASGVAVAIEALAHTLGHQLEACGEGGTRFVLELYRADGSAQEVRIGASRPCREPRHLIALLAEKLDQLDAGFGIDAMTLAATHAESHGATQIAIAGAGRAAGEATATALVDRLSNRLGAGHVLRLLPADSHIPERAQRRVSMLSAMCSAPLAPLTSALGTTRPAFLLPTPEAIMVLAEVPEGPPLRFSWRRLTHRIVRAQGPERIAPEWWRTIGRPPRRQGPPLAFHLARPRDYYFIEDEQGGRYWVFRAGLYEKEEDDETADDDSETFGETPAAPAWFMHGVIG